MESKKRILIIDSSSLIYRAFFALPPLSKNGQETGAVYGFLLTLFKAIKDLDANYVVACFDTPKPTFRHEMFKDYKGQRPTTPPGIISQIPIVKKVLQAFDIPVLEKEGFEADDLIATIATTFNGSKDAEAYIVSGDLDNLQLVNDQVKVYTMGKGIKDTLVYDTMKVRERFGVNPSQMNEYKALVGDTSDNIPGVKGIGKKTAVEIIEKYHTIKELYEELATDTAVLKPKVKEALKASKADALLSRELVETKKDVPINFILEDCRFESFDATLVAQVLSELGFTSLITRLPTLLNHALHE